MADSDGNGWVECRCGDRHWGRFGAAGLLLLRQADLGVEAAGLEVLVQLRAGWTHQGGTWGLPGGACDSHEDAAAAALREAGEEAGIDPVSVRVVAEAVGLDHGDWRYTYVLAVAEVPIVARAMTSESEDLAWIPVSGVPELPLHPALRSSWSQLLPLISALPGSRTL